VSAVVRSLVVAVIVSAMLVAASSPSAAHRGNAVFPVPIGPVAHQSGDDGGAEGDDDDGPIDCSIPDNRDDTGCDTGDVQDSEGAVGDSGDSENRGSGGADNVVPRGGVETGAGGTAWIRAYPCRHTCYLP
jgi:hypothetical protein